jgi:hypothetical protein
MGWIDINKEVPTWYTDVDIKVAGDVREKWHRLTADGGTIYYGSLETDEIIFESEVSHWKLSDEL